MQCTRIEFPAPNNKYLHKSECKPSDSHQIRLIDGAVGVFGPGKMLTINAVFRLKTLYHEFALLNKISENAIVYMLGSLFCCRLKLTKRPKKKNSTQLRFLLLNFDIAFVYGEQIKTKREISLRNNYTRKRSCFDQIMRKTKHKNNLQ